MKKYLLIGLMLIPALWMSAQKITGSWNGLLKLPGKQLRVVFHVDKKGAVYSATMDSPDQDVNGVPMTKATFKKSVFTVEMAAARIEYIGTLKNDTLFGTFNQAGQSFPLNMTKAELPKVETKRPQEPSKLSPYYSENITFVNSKANITLAGTLTLPSKFGKFPVVVLISGSGPQNRDEELMGHKPFLILSDYLTRNGIGVLRFDDRGCYESKGDFAKATTFDFATDVEAAIKYLKTRKEVDKKHIGLIGHSEGGIIASIVASKDKYVDFIVLLAGTGIPGSELLILQQEAIGKASGMTEEQLEKTKTINSGIFKIMTEKTDSTTIASELTEYLNKAIKENPDMQENLKPEDIIKQVIAQTTSPWMLNFIRYNPATALEKVKCPVLALNGSKDLQVPAKVNLPAIETSVKKGGNKKITTKELPGLNHLFQECNTGLPKEYAEIKQTMSPTALEEITSWIKQTIK